MLHNTQTQKQTRATVCGSDSRCMCLPHLSHQGLAIQKWRYRDGFWFVEYLITYMSKRRFGLGSSNLAHGLVVSLSMGCDKGLLPICFGCRMVPFSIQADHLINHCHIATSPAPATARQGTAARWPGRRGSDAKCCPQKQGKYRCKKLLQSIQSAGSLTKRAVLK